MGRRPCVRELRPHPSSVSALRLATVNLAHGRGTGAHQLLTRSHRLRSNLDAIGRWLAEVEADVACLQEADDACWWSGRFDHVRRVALRAGHEHVVRGHHVRSLALRYGTAVISKQAVCDSLSHTFAPTPPTFSKGFTLASIAWPGSPEFEVDVLSIHTDFARRSSRMSQIGELIATLRERGRPVIIAGDFNSQWRRGSALRLAVDALDLRTFEPEARMITFPTTGARLDWVLVSKELRLLELHSLDWKLSDHRPLLARIERH